MLVIAGEGVERGIVMVSAVFNADAALILQYTSLIISLSFSMDSVGGNFIQSFSSCRLMSAALQASLKGLRESINRLLTSFSKAGTFRSRSVFTISISCSFLRSSIFLSLNSQTYCDNLHDFLCFYSSAMHCMWLVYIYIII